MCARAQLTQMVSWQALLAHYQQIQHFHLRQLFADDPARGERLVCEGIGLYLDYSKNRITDETIKLLLALAHECGLRGRIDAMFGGEKINTTENRAVLHVALRAPRDAHIYLDGNDVVPEVHAVLDKMANFANRLRSGECLGYTGKPIRCVVNIGIGGSDLGPVMVYEALKEYSQRSLIFRFVSNVDGTAFVEAVRDLDPATTLFIISSKTSATLETMANRHTAARMVACAGPWQRCRRRQNTSSPSRRTRRKFLSSASTLRICLASGIGSEVAIQWTLPLGCPL